MTHTYNPLRYARAPHEAYLTRFGAAPKQVVLLGMNPGPFGMAQTGVPFGDVAMVRDWLGIHAEVGTPAHVHEKRPVLGFACARREVSGQRLWGWARERFGTPERFFERFFVVNYCPLAFIEASGKNRTPDKLPLAERQPLFAACDEALAAVVERLGARHVVGVGAFAEARARQVLGERDVRISTILHPSPQSPLANSGWAPRIEAQLEQSGIAL
ncbi:MAG TPA: uracil-DNA glycosylase family protein [Polyangiaceae bacterium]|nr:uracil-DNA glycosylase family protein [Polyangiaceae bacterium]